MSDKLVVIRGKHEGEQLDLSNSPVSLGAADECTMTLSDPGILDQHAVLELEDDTWHLRAVDPSRQIESEGRLLMQLRLNHGTVFELGHARLRFVASRAMVEGVHSAGESFEDPNAAVAELSRARDAILEQVGRIILGQKEVLNQIIVALFARGHCLLLGVPGLAKTLMVRTLASTLDLNSKRIQFTPDLMPADITGTDILEEDITTGRRHFRFNRGPLFTNMLLADEINRTPPKTQAALLEAMQEHRVTASGITYNLPNPFLVLATQNPIELEGTYPLPEAQLDRFMFCVKVDYPTAEEEPAILLATTSDRAGEVKRVLDGDTIIKFQHLVRQAPVSEHVAQYASSLARATRPGTEESPDFVSKWVRWGVGPRAGQYLLLAAKAHVLLNGRFNVSCDDVRAYALPVLRHRLFRNFAAASEGVTADDIVKMVVDHVKPPQY